MYKHTVMILINFVCISTGLQNPVSVTAQEGNVRPVSPYPDNLYQQPVMASYTHIIKPGNIRPGPTYTNIQTFGALPRPLEQHVKPRPVFDADVHFDEDVHYNVYRPIPEHDGFPQIIGDQHTLLRPPVREEQVSNNFVNHGNFQFPHQYGGPTHTSVPNRPNSNTYSTQVLIRPEHFNPLVIRPPFGPGNVLQGENNVRPLLLDNQPFVSGNPLSLNRKPQLVILAKNVFINQQKHGNYPNQYLANGQMSAIRFDHGRDHHIRPNTALGNIIDFLDIPKPPLFDKDIYNNIPKKEILSKPVFVSKDQDSAAGKPGINKPTQSSDQHRTVIGHSLTSTRKEGQEGLFHPLLSPMKTMSP